MQLTTIFLALPLSTAALSVHTCSCLSSIPAPAHGRLAAWLNSPKGWTHCGYIGSIGSMRTIPATPGTTTSQPFITPTASSTSCHRSRSQRFVASASVGRGIAERQNRTRTVVPTSFPDVSEEKPVS
jgi:hypothetical protein